MKTVKMFAILILALAVLVWPAEVSKAAPMGTAFTYQGRLVDANKPADGLYDLQFKLYDANVAGTQKGSTIDVNEMDVIEGLFTVLLDFGSNVFDGNAVWLEIGVRPGSLKDPNTYTTLSPRQEITPTPYALQTRGLFVDSALNVGIGTMGPISKLEVMSTENYHGVRSTVPYIAVYGHRTGTSGTWPGIHGECYSLSDNTSGVRGVISSTSPGTKSAGVRGVNNGTGTKGTGVYGWQAGDGYGVYGDTADNGIGVYGIHSSSTGQEPGVKGVTNTTSSYSSAILGEATATTGTTYGVRGVTASNSGIGVVGRATAPSGSTTGTAGQSDSIGGIGVWGWASNGEGTNYGGYFAAASPDGTGVFAFHDAGSGTTPAVMGRTDSDDSYAIGVHGLVNRTSPGSLSAGVLGENLGTGSNGIGVWGSHNGNGWGVYGTASGGAGKGVVGSGTGYDFYAAGSGIDYGSSSSIRWKRNIRSIDEALDKVMQLR
ncbi:MAG: hypothetical protein NTX52_12640, partial [Planctomycetota bacterium]|nr:hypothetical protein [Planctomycetota bacterium]